jgi:hypothetical protein
MKFGTDKCLQCGSAERRSLTGEPSLLHIIKNGFVEDTWFWFCSADCIFEAIKFKLPPEYRYDSIPHFIKSSPEWKEKVEETKTHPLAQDENAFEQGGWGYQHLKDFAAAWEIQKSIRVREATTQLKQTLFLEYQKFDTNRRAELEKEEADKREKIESKERDERWKRLSKIIQSEPGPMPPMTDDLPYSGTYVLAAQGYGKTTLLSKLILDRMNEPCSIIVFDTKPELTLKLRQYKFPKETVVITPDKYLALNPFDLGTKNLDILMGLFGSLGAGFTTLQSQALRQIVYLTSKISGATFDTFYEIVATGGKKYQPVIDSFDIRERIFWDEYPGGQYRETRGQVLWRLDTLTPPESLARTMFGAPTTKVKMRPLMDGNTLTIIDCTRDELGHQQTEFFGALFLAMIQAAGEQRARSDTKRPCYIFMDEADTVISRCPAVPEIIYRLRSQRVAFLAAHQSMSQIELPKVQDALNDCAIRYVNAKNDAPKIASHMGVDAEFIRTLRVGEFALSLQGQQAQKVKIPLPQFSYPKLSTIELADRIKRFKENYCYSPTSPEPPPETPQQKTW